MDRYQQHPMKILLALDSLEIFQAVVQLIQDLPLDKEQTQITLVTLMLPRDASSYASRTELLEAGQAQLEKLDLKTSVELLTGSAETLSEYAEQTHPDLLILETQSTHPTLSLLFGSLAEDVIESVSCPVFLVHAPYTGLETVVFATDGSPHSHCAGDFLAQFPLPASTPVQVLHVAAPPQEVFTSGFPKGPDTPEDIPIPVAVKEAAGLSNLELQLGQKLLAQELELLKSRGVAATGVLRQGEAAEEILHYTQEKPVGLIVCGSRSLGRIRGLLLGSVSNKLVREATCSVLVVKGGLNDSS